MKSELKNAIDVIVKEMKKCHSNIDGYAWVCIGSTDPPKDPYPFVDGWIMADFNIITCVDDNIWFRSEMESLLEEMFVPNLSLDYLVAFVFEVFPHPFTPILRAAFWATAMRFRVVVSVY